MGECRSPYCKDGKIFLYPDYEWVDCPECNMEYKYYYAWKNNPKREDMYSRRFKIISRGAMNSVLIEFENGQREVISGNAIRKVNQVREDAEVRVEVTTCTT